MDDVDPTADGGRPDAGEPDPWVPPDLPRSRTGRVPQWVLDEAAGRPHEPVPFRAWPEESPPPRRRGRRRAAWAVVAVVVAASTVALATLRGVPVASTAGSTSTPTTVASPSPMPTTAAPAASSAAPSTTAPTGPRAGLGEWARPPSLPLGDLHQDPKAGFRFLTFQKGTRTGVTWSPCRQVRVVVRGSGHAPPDGARMLREALAIVARDTGLDIVDDGPTKEPYSDDRAAYQPARYGDRWAPVLLSWSTTKEDPGLAGDVLGRAGPVWVESGSGDRTYVSGEVSLDAAQIATLRRTEGYAVARAVVLHELGHLVGLAHVTQRSSLMYPRASRTVTDFSAADRKGLRLLGEGPCQPDA